MRPKLADDDAQQYNSLLERLNRLEQSLAPEPTRYVGAIGQPPFENSWVNYDTSRITGFYRNAGRVYLVGAVKSGPIGTAVFTLPAGYRPIALAAFPASALDAFGELVINTTGTVVPVLGSNAIVNLDGFSFRHI